MIVNKFPMRTIGGIRHIYGVTWAGTSTTVLTRTDDSANFSDPIAYKANATNYGSPFDNLYPWSGMVRVTDAQAGEMVKIPKFWYKLTQNGKAISIQIADAPTDGFATCPACMDRGDGNGERDYILVGRYHCASTYKSQSGVKPLTRAHRSDFRPNIQGLGSGIYMMDFATRFTIWLLCLVEYANWDSTSKIGSGCGNNSSSGNMGYTDSMPYHTGTTQSSFSTYGLGTQYRYIEGMWDNVRDWTDGCYNNSSGLNIILNPSNFSDSANGTSVGTPTSGYASALSVKTVSNTFPLFIPSASSGSANKYTCTSWPFDASKPCYAIGNNYSQTGTRGLFNILTYAINNSPRGCGSRPMKLPDFSNQ